VIGLESHIVPSQFQSVFVLASVLRINFSMTTRYTTQCSTMTKCFAMYCCCRYRHLDPHPSSHSAFHGMSGMQINVSVHILMSRHTQWTAQCSMQTGTIQFVIVPVCMLHCTIQFACCIVQCACVCCVCVWSVRTLFLVSFCP